MFVLHLSLYKDTVFPKTFQNTFNSDKSNYEFCIFTAKMLREVRETSWKKNNLELVFVLYLSNF